MIVSRSALLEITQIDTIIHHIYKYTKIWTETNLLISKNNKSETDFDKNMKAMVKEKKR